VAVSALDAALEALSAGQFSLETAEEPANLRRTTTILEPERLSSRSLETLQGERRQSEATMMQAEVKRAQATPATTDPKSRPLLDEATLPAAELAGLA
jgi:hypothetical protein